MKRTNMKRTNKLSIICCLIVCVMVVLPTAAFATEEVYQGGLSRGVQYICYAESQFIWRSNETHLKIDEVDSWQATSGLCTEVKGITKLNAESSDSKHAYNCAMSLLAGAVIEGVTLGFRIDSVDKFTMYSWGSWDIDWDD